MKDSAFNYQIFIPNFKFLSCTKYLECKVLYARFILIYVFKIIIQKGLPHK